MTTRVDVTAGAAELLDRLAAQHGPLMFHQSGGCCDGSSPMCFPLGEFRVGANDVFLGRIGPQGTPFYIGGAQFEYWSHTALTVDVVPGRGAGFSLEAPEGVRFITVSRLFTDEEEAELASAGPVARGPQPDGDPGSGSGSVSGAGSGPGPGTATGGAGRPGREAPDR